MTKRQIENKVREDFAGVQGRVVRTNFLHAYDSNGNSHDVDLDPPIAVLIDSTGEDLKHQCDNWIDPYWSVTPLENRGELNGLHGFEMFGHSYEIGTGKFEPASFVCVSAPVALKLRLARLLGMGGVA